MTQHTEVSPYLLVEDVAERLRCSTRTEIHEVAEQCGYSSDAVARSFRARFWAPAREVPERSLTRRRVIGVEP
jgi:transcriptional regulator GlxA family with amidase domain